MTCKSSNRWVGEVPSPKCGPPDTPWKRDSPAQCFDNVILHLWGIVLTHVMTSFSRKTTENSFHRLGFLLFWTLFFVWSNRLKWVRTLITRDSINKSGSVLQLVVFSVSCNFSILKHCRTFFFFKFEILSVSILVIRRGPLISRRLADRSDNIAVATLVALRPQWRGKDGCFTFP